MALNQSFGSSPLEFATNALLPAPWGGLEPESAKQPRVSSPIAQKKILPPRRPPQTARSRRKAKRCTRYKIWSRFKGRRTPKSLYLDVGPAP
mmetsp:Transcript_16963/g.52863  ORF Transcript_16963/g.52863 Transcript_16963/m.52863 type:complete len:92 (+) Transcript_16963:1772-2047(+)